MYTYGYSGHIQYCTSVGTEAEMKHLQRLYENEEWTLPFTEAEGTQPVAEGKDAATTTAGREGDKHEGKQTQASTVSKKKQTQASTVSKKRKATRGKENSAPKRRKAATGMKVGHGHA